MTDHPDAPDSGSRAPAESRKCQFATTEIPCAVRDGAASILANGRCGGCGHWVGQSAASPSPAGDRDKPCPRWGTCFSHDCTCYPPDRSDRPVEGLGSRTDTNREKGDG